MEIGRRTITLDRSAKRERKSDKWSCKMVNNQFVELFHFTIVIYDYYLFIKVGKMFARTLRHY